LEYPSRGLGMAKFVKGGDDKTTEVIDTIVSVIQN
jgi:hypothetical protein